MYIETASSKKGDTARLVSPRQQGSGGLEKFCILEFWYNRNGDDDSTLNVYIRSADVDNNETLLWSLSGNEFDAWHPINISFNWLQQFDFEV